MSGESRGSGRCGGRIAAITAACAGRANAEIAVYPGCGHNFSMPCKSGYDADAAAKSRAAVLEYFRGM